MEGRFSFLPVGPLTSTCILIPFPLHLLAFLFPSVQIYDQGVQLFQENFLILLIGGSIQKTVKEERLVFAPSYTHFWIVLR